MAKFSYKYVKNASISSTSFELNYDYYFQAFYTKVIDFYFELKLANKLDIKLKIYMAICRKNLEYV